MINAEIFYDTFLRSYRHDLRINDIKVNELMSSALGKTHYMLGEKSNEWPTRGLLIRTIESLGIKMCYRLELYKLDLVAWRSKRASDLHKPINRQPMGLEIIVEHENKKNKEEEFWKLMHWYAPLKVIVCYGRTDGDGMYDKPNSFLTFQAMLGDANNFHKRNISEEYLILWGDQPAQSQTVEWDATIFKTPGGKVEINHLPLS